jgi:putative glutamine amidotransferase
MKKPPLILVTPCSDPKGVELSDASISLSEAYLRAVMRAGGMPLTMPPGTSREMAAHCVSACDGVLLSGGDDINTEIYAPKLPRSLLDKAGRPDHDRDLRELMVIEEVFLQHKPLLAICRGHQLLNVAFGGTLLVDIPTQRPEALNHRRFKEKDAVAHDVQLREGSLLAAISGKAIIGTNSTHHQAVDRVADLFVATGWTSDGMIEAMELGADARRLLPFLVSVQYHPERLIHEHAEHRAVFEAFIGACAATRKSGGRRARGTAR